MALRWQTQETTGLLWTQDQPRPSAHPRVAYGEARFSARNRSETPRTWTSRARHRERFSAPRLEPSKVCLRRIDPCAKLVGSCGSRSSRTAESPKFCAHFAGDPPIKGRCAARKKILPAPTAGPCGPKHKERCPAIFIYSRALVFTKSNTAVGQHNPDRGDS